jgi:uncharacterized protein
MGSEGPHRRAVVISSADLGDGARLMVHNCEDCACAVSGSGPTPGTGQARPPDKQRTRWVRGREVLEAPLDSLHHVMFNPLGAGGAVVVNEVARNIARSFHSPSTFDERRDELARHGDGSEAAFERLASLGILHPLGRPAEPQAETGRTLTAWLHVTNACNLRCPYCYVNKSGERLDDSVGFAAVDAVVRSAVEHGFPAVKLKYAGGEASLNSRLLLDLHAYARQLTEKHGLNLTGTLLSNGVALSDDLITALKSGDIRVMVSLDGVGRDHDVQRPFVHGGGSFHRVTRTIQRLSERGHPPHLSITVTNRNTSGLAAAVRYALHHDLTFSLNFFRDNDCAAAFTDLRYEEQAMTAAVFEAFAVIEEYLPAWSVLGAVLDRGQLITPRQRPCGVGHDYIVIDQRGRVAKCHMEIERTVGDVFGGDVLDLIRGDETGVRNPPADEKEGCRDCTWRHWCSGGCPVATFRATGRYDIKSPNCDIYRSIYPAALRLEGLRLLKYAPRNTS